MCDISLTGKWRNRGMRTGNCVYKCFRAEFPRGVSKRGVGGMEHGPRLGRAQPKLTSDAAIAAPEVDVGR
jgi:hypothetical protein